MENERKMRGKKEKKIKEEEKTFPTFSSRTLFLCEECSFLLPIVMVLFLVYLFNKYVCAGDGTVWGERLGPGKPPPALSPFWAAMAGLRVLEPWSWREPLPQF